MALTITSNNHPRRLLTASELTPAELDSLGIEAPADPEDWEAWPEGYYFRAYGNVWALDDFERFDRGISVMVAAPTSADKGSLDRWHAIAGQSHFHALVIRLNAEGESVTVGWAQW